MAFGDYSGPNKANKGMEGGACNWQRCQAEPATWFNHGSSSWYCVDCRHDIETDPVNSRDWQARWFPSLGHPMFETRAMIDARTGPAARHDRDCDWHLDQYDWECTCRLTTPGVPGFHPLMTPQPLPPATMTRQQRRHLARKGRP